MTVARHRSVAFYWVVGQFELWHGRLARAHGRDAHATLEIFKLTHYRKSAGLTQQQLAKRAGIPQETLSRIESGKHSPTLKTLKKIDRALGKDSLAVS
jgi:DNA-binding XRE family transcriptional regulator